MPLSNPLTFMFKFVFPVLIIPGICVQDYLLLAQKTQPVPTRGDLVFLLLLSAALIAGFLYNVRLKRVVGGDNTLVISDYCTEVVIPYEAILHVRPRTFMGNGEATLTLSKSTVLGKRVRFLLPSERMVLMPPWAEHPAIQFLRAKGVAVKT
jgi:hypothetical protein